MSINVNSEMNKLIHLLHENHIPFEIGTGIYHDEAAIQIFSPSAENCLIDAISHYYSYGGRQGLIELMGHGSGERITNYDVVGWLTAKEAIGYFTPIKYCK